MNLRPEDVLPGRTCVRDQPGHTRASADHIACLGDLDPGVHGADGGGDLGLGPVGVAQGKIPRQGHEEFAFHHGPVQRRHLQPRGRLVPVPGVGPPADRHIAFQSFLHGGRGGGDLPAKRFPAQQFLDPRVDAVRGGDVRRNKFGRKAVDGLKAAPDLGQLPGQGFDPVFGFDAHACPRLMRRGPGWARRRRFRRCARPGSAGRPPSGPQGS